MSKVTCSLPAAEQVCGTAPVTQRLPQATGNVRPRAFTSKPVIPAQAGIHKPVRMRQEPDGLGNMDSRLRGNDEGKELIHTLPSC